MRQRLLTLALVAVFVAVDFTSTAGAAPAAAPDPTYPTGSFTIPQTSEYIRNNGWDYQLSRVPLVRLSLSDDTTPADEIVVRVYSGTDLGRSSNGEEMPPGVTQWKVWYGGGLDEDPFPWFDLAGTYQPYVTLTDADNRTTRIDLPQVTLLHDRVAPVTRLTLPRKSRRDTMVAWRHIRGTIRDAGIDRPGGYNSFGTSAQVAVLQKRRGVWYAYECYTPDPTKQRTWCKGKPTLAATLRKFKGLGISTDSVGATGWRTPYIRGLTRGPLALVVEGSDCNFNWTKRIYTGFKITRRR